MKRLIRFGAAIAGLALAAAACSSGSSSGNNGTPSAAPTTAATAVGGGSTSPPPTAQPSTRQPGATRQPTTPPTSRPTAPSPADKVKVTAASADYLLRAVPARADYYRFARSLIPSERAKALHRLSNWYTGTARQDIINEVKLWDPNYSSSIDVTPTIEVLSGKVHPDGTITLETIESWKIETEGGPIRDAHGGIVSQQTDTRHTMHLMLFIRWGVTAID